MRKFMNKNNFINLIFLLTSELICFAITTFALSLSDKTYFFAMNIIYGLYFLPIFLATIYILFYSSSDKCLIVTSSVGLILYSIILHIFIVPICSTFINIQGIINLIQYISKIYFICLPLVGFRIFISKKSYFIVFIRIIILALTTFLFKYWFDLQSILYAIPFSEFIIFIFSIIKYKNSKVI